MQDRQTSTRRTLGSAAFHFHKGRSAGVLRWIGALATVAGVGAILASPVSATTFDRVTAVERLQQADLVFEGVVTAVQHRNSDVAGPEQISLPHTFVTYSIKRVFRGSSAAGSSITLRMQGGPNGEGLTLKVSGVPEFKPGDTDILFVAGGSNVVCPLVGFDQGRLRIVRGQVYNDLGQEVWVGPQGNFLFGPARINVDSDLYPALLGAAKAGEPSREFTPPEGAMRPDAAGFGDLLGAIVAQAASHGMLRAAPPVASASFGDTFHVSRLVPAAPPVDSSPAAPVSEESRK